MSGAKAPVPNRTAKTENDVETKPFSVLFFSIAAATSVYFVGGAFAQNSSDEILYTIMDDAGSPETLYKSNDGKLIFRRNSIAVSDDRSDSNFYLRETWLIKDMRSVSIDETFSYGNDIFITVETRPAAVLREHLSTVSNVTGVTLQFPKSEKATANGIFRKLKSLAGK